MGLFDSLFGTKDSKTTTKSSYGSEIDDLQKKMAMGAFNGINGYLSNPAVFTAPLSDAQNNVGQAASELSHYNRNTNYAGSLPDYASQYMALGGMPGGDASFMDQFIPGYSQQAIDASTIDMGDIMGFANPYADAVMDNGMRRLDDAYSSSQADIGRRSAASGAFGGSGEFISRNMLDEDRMNAVNDLTTQTLYDSYGMGAQLAGQNAGAKTAALQAAGNDIYGRALGSATYGDNVRNDNFNRSMSALQGASQYGLSAAGANNGFANDYTSRQLQSLGLLGGYGDMQRGYAQAVGDQPYTQFQRLAGLIPDFQPSTTSTSPTNNTGLLGTAVTALGLFGK